MPNYQTMRKEAFKLIDSLHHKGINEERILFIIQTEYGFGKRFVDERLRLVQTLQNLDKDGDKTNELSQ